MPLPAPMTRSAYSGVAYIDSRSTPIVEPLGAHRLERGDALVAVARRHPDVEDGRVDAAGAHDLEQLVARSDRGDDLDAAALEHLRDALAQQQRVVGDRDAQGAGVVHRTSVSQAGETVRGSSPA